MCRRLRRTPLCRPCAPKRARRHRAALSKFFITDAIATASFRSGSAKVISQRRRSSTKPRRDRSSRARPFINQRGLPELREAIARYLARVYASETPLRGLYAAERFSVTIGGMHALQLALRLVAGAGDEAIVITPAWPNFRGALTVSGASVIERPLHFSGAGAAGQWQLDLAQLGSRAHVANARHYNQFTEQSDRLDRFTRRACDNPRHRASPRLVDHRRRDLRPLFL